MQKRAGLLFLAKNTSRILLIHENQKWTVPTFIRCNSLIEDAQTTLKEYSIGKIIPIELYLSEDNGFEYGTYVCMVDSEFLIQSRLTFTWALLEDLPKNLHTGLKSTLNNPVIKIKIETIMELENVATY